MIRQVKSPQWTQCLFEKYKFSIRNLGTFYLATRFLHESCDKERPHTEDHNFSMKVIVSQKSVHLVFIGEQPSEILRHRELFRVAPIVCLRIVPDSCEAYVETVLVDTGIYAGWQACPQKATKSRRKYGIAATRGRIHETEHRLRCFGDYTRVEKSWDTRDVIFDLLNFIKPCQCLDQRISVHQCRAVDCVGHNT